VRSCQIDKVRNDVLDYRDRCKALAKEEGELKRRIAEFDGKIFTNQKAGVDLLKALLVEATEHYAERFSAITVRSRLIRPHHRQKARALRDLARAYRQLMKAYPREDFPGIRAGLRRREQAMRELAQAELRIHRLIRKYESQRR
jgi:hypothetical protein